MLDVKVIAVENSESLTRQSKEEDRRSLAGYRTAGGADCGREEENLFFYILFSSLTKGEQRAGDMYMHFRTGLCAGPNERGTRRKLYVKIYKRHLFIDSR